MKVLMVVPEIAPFFKYSRLGLGENLRSLLFHLPEDVMPLMPCYSGVNYPGCTVVDSMPALGLEVCSVSFPAGERQLLVVRPADGCFSPFTDDNIPLEQIVLFSRGVAEFVRRYPEWEIVHCHHWQTGLIPLLLRELDQAPLSLFTFHDLEVHAPLYLEDLAALRLHHDLALHVSQIGPLSLLKLGVRFAHLLSTTSKTYAEEVRTEEHGHELDVLLTQRQDQLFGIMNGVRYGEWNPAKDPLIKTHYTHPEGKAAARTALRNELRLPDAPDVPLLFYGGRLDVRHGADLMLEALPELAAMPLQLVIYGTGDDDVMLRLDDQKDAWPNVRVCLGYDEAFLHRLVAGADVHLLPSREEPGGAMHLVSLRYGAIPVASRTGGHADAIHDLSQYGHERVNGFLFSSYYATSMLQTVQEALDVFAEPTLWCQYMARAMQAEWSWKDTARAYEELYERIITL